MKMIQDRRRFLTTLAAAGATGLIGPPSSNAQDGRLETTTIRIGKIAGICIAPQYVADELLRAEGFTDIRYVATNAGVEAALSLARGDLDFTANYAPPLIIPIDAGEPITIVGGEHIGCFELFAKEGIRSIADLKGKTVGVQGLGSSQHVFVSTMAAHVGLDPARDIYWVTSSSIKPMELFAEGKIDAFLGFPPEPQELRARNIGRVIVNSVSDRGRDTSAAFWRDTGITSAGIRSRPSDSSARSSKPPISAALSRSKSRSGSSPVDSPPAMIMRCRRSRKSRMQNGGNTMPKTRSDSTRLGCAKLA